MADQGETIAAYEKALSELKERLEQSNNEKNSPCRIAVLAVLVARDAVASSIEANRPLNPQTLYCIYELDQQLKDRAMEIVRATEAFTFSDFRDTAHPPDYAWWWSLDKRGPEEEQRRNPLWAILAALFSIMSMIFITVIGQRLIGKASYLQGPTGPLLPNVIKLSGFILAFIAGGSLTATGQKLLGKLLAYIGIAHKFRPRRKAFWAAILMLAALALGLLLPAVALLYHEKGNTYQIQGDWSRARQCYEFALELNPDFPQAHYNLGTIYENYKQYDEAMNEYRTAIKLNSRYNHAYNNLARLYILKQNDFGTALSLIDRGIELTQQTQPDDTQTFYSLYKNRGWAHYRLNAFDLANEDLRQAISYAGQGGAGAHCLRAYVLEAKHEPADEEWQSCLANANADSDEPTWKSDAEQRLYKISQYPADEKIEKQERGKK
jgi:tetratricopeptide (TPR) repeat protein